MIFGDQSKPLIVQGDGSLLLETFSPSFEAARNDISRFSELDKSPEHIHTYHISPLSLWNAASAGMSAEQILDLLETWSRFPIPQNISRQVETTISRYGLLILEDHAEGNSLFLRILEKRIFLEIEAKKSLAKYLQPSGEGFLLNPIDRGSIKVELLKLGYPVQDMARLSAGDRLDISLRENCLSGEGFSLRDYQIEAASAFHGKGNPGNGFGVIVLPCGSGKTVVGMKAMELLQTNTLIITTNIAAVHQWMDELLDKTTIREEDIKEYSGGCKEIGPVTVATYQILTWRKKKTGIFPHFDLFRARNWGLIIYDEVHLLPAPVFRVTAEIQAVRRLGLTATLIREDGREKEVFSLVGPKRYDVPWKELEQKGWIAQAFCHEIRIPMDEKFSLEYAVASGRNKFRIASENAQKNDVVRQLIENHPEDSILVIGQYINQLHKIAELIQAPVITGSTPHPEREEIYRKFKAHEFRVIVVSKVANFAIDLPDASVAIQVSGTFGSRQEEAQRLGRILRPKERNSYFYSIVSSFSIEEDFSMNRQKFLTEQGYSYHIEVWNQ